ncbi:hypothetical protein BC629DRAFT_753258 [Irpex lacteus]|nr:hypothetical protein BC629DRAFT_753258 [Irpex lacteus]
MRQSENYYAAQVRVVGLSCSLQRYLSLSYCATLALVCVFNQNQPPRSPISPVPSAPQLVASREGPTLSLMVYQVDVLVHCAQRLTFRVRRQYTRSPSLIRLYWPFRFCHCDHPAITRRSPVRSQLVRTHEHHARCKIHREACGSRPKSCDTRLFPASIKPIPCWLSSHFESRGHTPCLAINLHRYRRSSLQLQRIPW